MILDVRKAEERAREFLKMHVQPCDLDCENCGDSLVVLTLAALARRLSHALNSVHAGTAYEPAELADARRAGLLED